MIQLGVFLMYVFFYTFNHIRMMIDDPSMIQQVDVPLKTHTVLNSQIYIYISLDIFRNLQISVRPSATFLTGGLSLQGCAFGRRSALLARGTSRPGAGARYLGLTVQRGSGDFFFRRFWCFFGGPELAHTSLFGVPIMEYMIV